MEIQLRSEQVKASITLEFDNPASLYAAVDRLRGKDVSFTVSIPPTAKLGDLEPRPAIPVTPTGEVIAQPVVEKTRKPRADAGKPRGPYKTSTTGEPAASEPGVQGGDLPVAPQPAAPVTPTTSASPDARVAEQRTVNPPEAGANPVGGPTLTLDDARAALKRIKDTKGLATPACIAHIQSFGVDAISKLPAEKYAEFIRQADEKIAAHLATVKV
jgi:hypothetical protein